VRQKINHQHGDTEHTEKCTAERRIFSVSPVQEKRLHGSHREGASFRRTANLRILRVSVVTIYSLYSCQNHITTAVLPAAILLRRCQEINHPINRIAGGYFSGLLPALLCFVPRNPSQSQGRVAWRPLSERAYFTVYGSHPHNPCLHRRQTRAGQFCLPAMQAEGCVLRLLLQYPEDTAWPDMLSPGAAARQYQASNLFIADSHE
jgi:hypothetical protein